MRLPIVLANLLAAALLIALVGALTPSAATVNSNESLMLDIADCLEQNQPGFTPNDYREVLALPLDQLDIWFERNNCPA